MANYRSFTNRSCEFYPCHKTDKLNCLFCFCPLYFLDCGGNFKLTSRGLKDCSECLLPHSDAGYDYIVSKLVQVAAERYPERDIEPAGDLDETLELPDEEGEIPDLEPVCELSGTDPACELVDAEPAGDEPGELKEN